MIPLFDRNPTRRTPVVTLGIMAINVLVFLYMLFLKETDLDIFTYRFSVIPWEVVHGSQLPAVALREIFSYPIAAVPSKQVYLALFTSMFLHGGWLHILGNMLYLWIFGNNVEDVMGHIPFLFFYLFCGLFGTMVHIAFYSKSITPLLGASGAISGVLGAYLLLYPRAWIYTLFFFFIVPIPAFVVLGFWILLQFFQGLTAFATGMSTGTAWFAHLGGVSMGVIITVVFYPVLRRRREELRMMPSRYWWQ